MNLLMVAPLYDNRGTIRYFIGAQVDISGLIEDGRGLDSFARCLEEKGQQRQRDNDLAQESASNKSLRVLKEFGQLLSVDESSAFQSHSRSNSMQDNGSSTNFSSRAPPRRRETGMRQARRVLGNEERDEGEERTSWAFSSTFPSGKLPGVYQNVRIPLPHGVSIDFHAYPTIQITSTSWSALTLPFASSSFPPLSASRVSSNHRSSPASGDRHMFAMVSLMPSRLERPSPPRCFGFHKAVVPPKTTPPLPALPETTIMSPPVP